MTKEEKLVQILFKEKRFKMPNSLMRLGYVSIINPELEPTFDNIKISQKGENFLMDMEEVEDATFNDFIVEFRDLFNPKKNSQMFFDKRGDRSECLNKMKNFLNVYTFTYGEILEATRNYINSLESTKFCREAHYFIEKTEFGNKISTLREWCLRLKDVDESINSNRV